MLKIQEFINCFDSVQEAGIYLNRELGIDMIARPLNDDKALYLFKAGQHSDMKNPLVRETNCLVLDSEGKLCAKAWDHPFVAHKPNEIPSEFGFGRDNSGCELSDGTIVVAYNVDDEWYIGTANDPEAQDHFPGFSLPGFTFEHEVKALLNRRAKGKWTDFFKGVAKDLCLVFNYVNPYIDTVMPQTAQSLYFMGAIDKLTGTEVPTSTADSLATMIGFTVPNKFNTNGFASLTPRLQSMRALSPGLMLKDNNDQRLVIVNPIYKAVKSAKDAGERCQPVHIAKIIQICRDKGDMVAVKSAYKGYTNMLELMWAVRIKLWEELKELWGSAHGKELKEFAGIVQHHPLNYLLFLFRNKEINSVLEGLDGIKPYKLVHCTKRKYEKEFYLAANLLKYEGGKTDGVAEKESGEEEGTIPYCQEGD
jgi:hypothetical protein